MWVLGVFQEHMASKHYLIQWAHGCSAYFTSLAPIEVGERVKGLMYHCSGQFWDTNQLKLVPHRTGFESNLLLGGGELQENLVLTRGL